MSPSATVPLVDALRVLREQHGVSTSRYKLWRFAVEGQIPATQIGGRWFVAVADLSTAAALLRP
jgi:hypothetical protein